MNFFLESVRESQSFAWVFFSEVCVKHNSLRENFFKNSMREVRTTIREKKYRIPWVKPENHAWKKKKKSVCTPCKRRENLQSKVYKVPVTMTNRDQVSNDNQKVAVTNRAVFPWNAVLGPSFIVYRALLFPQYIQVTPEIKRCLLCTAQPNSPKKYSGPK